MNKQFLTILLFLSLLGLSFVFYNNAMSEDADLDVSELEAKIKELNESLKELSEEYAELKSSLPVPVEEQLIQMKDKISELDSVVTDQTDLLRKIDPNGILQDTENWISESYELATNMDQNGWARVSAAEVLDRYNRLDEAAYESVSDVYLNADNGRMKAYALGVIKDHVTEDMKQPMLDNLNEVTKDGEFTNGWLTYNLVESLGNFSDDPQVHEKLNYLAVNHPDVNIARKAAEKIGLEIVEED
jgi:hypothetical protein